MLPTVTKYVLSPLESIWMLTMLSVRSVAICVGAGSGPRRARCTTRVCLRNVASASMTRLSAWFVRSARSVSFTLVELFRLTIESTMKSRKKSATMSRIGLRPKFTGRQ